MPAASFAQVSTDPSKKPTDPLAIRMARSVNSLGGRVRLAFAGLEDGGHEPLAGDHQAEPVGGRGEVALHQAVDRPSGEPGVDHRVDFPDPEGLEVEQFGADLAFEGPGVDLVVERGSPAGGQGGELAFQVGDPGEDLGAGEVFELAIILVEPGRGPFAGVGWRTLR